jgi:DNA-binding transcriptional ArsR family regulator
MVKHAGDGLASAVEAGDWNRADRELQYLVGAWQRARLRGADGAQIASLVDRLRMEVVDDYDVDQVPGPDRIAWMLSGVCSFLNQAATPEELNGEDVRSRILEALAADDEPYATSALAERIDRSVGATARELPKLRDAGLTVERSAGRRALNSITDAGRAENARLAVERARRHDETRDWPTTLERRHDAELAPMDPRDLMQHLKVNDVAALKLARR